jgi:folate-dependent phosphoribosylglycinamide formyltransferase PurN
MRIGIVGSSAGSVARELICAARSDHDFVIVTDRPCGLESVAEEFSLPCMRVDESDNARFSQRAKYFFDQQGGSDLVLLFYLRLVTSELFKAYPTFNIHPSLLPDYRGFNAIERAHADRVKQFGATLHLVDEKADHGPLVAQVLTELKSEVSIEQMRRISFAQKTYLALYLLDLFELNRYVAWAEVLKNKESPTNPAINNKSLFGYFNRFVAREGFEEALM